MNAGSVTHLKPNLTNLKPVCKGQYFGSILLLQKSPEVGFFFCCNPREIPGGAVSQEIF